MPKVVLSLENFGFISWTRISEVLKNLGLDTCRLQHWNKRVWNDTDNFIYASMYAKRCTISWKFRIYFVNKNFGGTQKSWFRHLSATALEQKGLKWNDTDNFIYASMYAKSCTISWKFRIYFVNKNFGGTQKSWFRHLSATALEQKGLKWYRQLYLCLHVCQKLYYLLKISDLFREQEFRRYSKILV